MHFRPIRPLFALAFASSALVLLGAAPARAAGEKDKEAMKLFDQAMGDDYLSTEFSKAEKKLKEALKKCGSDGCSPSVVGKIHVALGTVYGVGMSKMDPAKEEFAAAFKADPKAVLDDALTNAELTKAFNDAKKAASASAKAAPEEKPEPDESEPKKPKGKKPKESASSGEVIVHTPPAESVVNTPVPIYVEPTEEVPLSKVVLRYKPFGGTSYKSIDMTKMGKGFGVEIPCKDATTTGDIKYFFILTDDAGESAGTAGSMKEPYKIPIKNEIDGDPPVLPGKRAPEQCKEAAACPPDFPGCQSTTTPKKPVDAPCEQTDQCQDGLTCLNGSCTGTATATPTTGTGKRNMISAAAQFDFLSINNAANVCTASLTNTNHACFLPASSTQYFGPTLDHAGTNGIQGGLAFADVRIMLGYDRQLFEKLPLTAGIRLGWALGGPPSPDNTAKSGPLLTFVPFHFEARAGYHFGGNGFEHKKLRPYAFVGGGYANMDASVPVTVCDKSATAVADATVSPTCFNLDQNHKKIPTTPPSKQRTVEAYQITGLGFIDFGGGIIYAITPNFGVQAELKMMVMLPTVGFALAPSLGPVVGF